MYDSVLGQGQTKGTIYVTSILCTAVEMERGEQKTTKEATKQGSNEAMCGRTGDTREVGSRA